MASSSSSARCGATRIRRPESSENNPIGNILDVSQMHPPLRSPLVSIQEPSQNPREAPASKGTGSTPRSTQSTPTKAVSRVGDTSSIAHSVVHYVPCVGTRDRGSSSRISGRLTDSKLLVPVEVPYFELNEDPSYWKDHNVQVLIRIRPINSAESASHGYNRCLMQESSQTLVWAGHPETRFTFDHIACEAISQDKLFKVVGQPMVENCMSGYNSCLFAYGQTGSGKTYTMMGEIHDFDRSFGEDCGITPRIFQYLFLRIREAEETQHDEKLKYSCKCSFLEIYNEQITDLLEPSSTNLQLREDLAKGVYVENLKEHEVSSVKDVIKLLLQGAANRKIAATNMNSESSRSHSVFTCVIESRWEIDSMTHLRFGRLNLVDLAGSERQKSSGAEGDRLKEAANINRSLSTLGLVIMTLADIASGRSRHIPYRDSRLTFLLQDSLGGNSKTSIIANVSPSISSASETLSTLKFAQRAKLIQNNAKVNEDASGDVMALQRQIQKLKDQLTFVIKHQNTQRSRCSIISSAELHDLGESAISKLDGNSGVLMDSIAVNQKVKLLESALCDALQREKAAEATIQRLEAEMDHLNHLVQGREDGLKTKVILKSEEKIRRLEMLADGLLSSNGDLLEDNKSISEEIQLPQSRIHENPESAQFALEDMRSLEQLRMYPEFYHQGEHGTTLAEVSRLCTQHFNTSESQYKLSRSKVHEATDLEQLEADCPISQQPNNPAKLVCLDTKCADSALITNLEKSQIGKEARILDRQLQYDVSQLLCRDERACVQEQVEVESSKKDLYLQEGLIAVPQEDGSTLSNLLFLRTQLLMTGKSGDFSDEDSYLLQENVRLADLLANKDAELSAISNEWEKAIVELTNFLLDGCKSLEDAQDHIEAVVDLFPHKNVWINEHVERAIKVVIEKETSIVNLQNCLEDAQKMWLELKSKLNSLRGATLAMTEFHQLENDENSKELFDLRKLLREKNVKIHELEGTLIHKENQILEAEKTAHGALELLNESYGKNFSKSVDAEALASMVNVFLNERSHYRKVNQLRDLDPVETGVENQIHPADAENKYAQIPILGGNLSSLFEQNRGMAPGIGEEILCSSDALRVVVEMAVQKVLESEICLCTSYAETEEYLTDLLSDIKTSSFAVRTMFRDAIADVSACNSMLKGLKDQKASPHFGFDSLVSAEKQLDKAADLFQKIEAAQHTMEEAELMLNALLKANNDTKSEKDWWEQKCKELLEEKAVLTEKVKLLDASSYAKEEQCLNLQYQVHDSFDQSLGLASSLDGSFQQISGHGLNMIRSDMVNIRQDMLQWTETSRSWPEVKISEAIELGLVQTVICQCYLGAFLDLIMPLSSDSGTIHNRHPLTVHNNRQMPCMNTLEEGVLSSGTKCTGTQNLLSHNNSSLGDEMEMFLSCQAVKHVVAKPTVNVHASSYETSKLSHDPEHLLERIAVLDKETIEIAQDMKLVEVVIDKLAIWLGNLIQEVGSSCKTIEGTNFPCGKETEIDSVEGPLETEIISSGHLSGIGNDESIQFDIAQSSNTKLGESESYSRDDEMGGLLSDVAPIFSSIQHLKSQCDELMLLQSTIVGHRHLPIWKDIDMQKTSGTTQCSKPMKEADMIAGNLHLKKQLDRKEDLMKGQIFDIRLLQESNINAKDMKDESEEAVVVLNKARHELEMKNAQTADILRQQESTEVLLSEYEMALSRSRSELEEAEKTISTLSDQNNDLRVTLENEYVKRIHTEELLEDKTKIIECFERQAICANYSVKRGSLHSVEDIMNDLKRISDERDQLRVEIVCLNEKFDMASALAEESEAIAVEARQVAEENRIYAQEKEEEVRILERSVQELEDTIEVLGKKACELKEETEQQQLIRRDLELEVKSLTERMLRVECATETLTAEDSDKEEDFQIQKKHCRKTVERYEIQQRIKDFEMEIAAKEEEIKLYKDHISELLLHSEAQSSIYQEKFKALEGMVSEVKTEPVTSSSVGAITKITERAPIRARGTGSPFKCIASLVQQVNSEKDKELQVARQRIEELEALAARKQKEVFTLNARLAAVESMTHDVIRDLLGVKLDMTTYANVIEQDHLQKLIEVAQQQAGETDEKDREIMNLKKQIDHLVEERDSWMAEINQTKVDILGREVKLERLQQRDQLLTAQMELLKKDKANLHHKIAELDNTIKSLVGSHRNDVQIQHHLNIKQDRSKLGRELAPSDRLLSHARNELGLSRRFNSKTN